MGLDTLFRRHHTRTIDTDGATGAMWAHFRQLKLLMGVPVGSGRVPKNDAIGIRAVHLLHTQYNRHVSRVAELAADRHRALRERGDIPLFIQPPLRVYVHYADKVAMLIDLNDGEGLRPSMVLPSGSVPVLDGEYRVIHRTNASGEHLELWRMRRRLAERYANELQRRGASQFGTWIAEQRFDIFCSRVAELNEANAALPHDFIEIRNRLLRSHSYLKGRRGEGALAQARAVIHLATSATIRICATRYAVEQTSTYDHRIVLRLSKDHLTELGGWLDYAVTPAWTPT